MALHFRSPAKGRVASSTSSRQQAECITQTGRHSQGGCVFKGDCGILAVHTCTMRSIPQVQLCERNEADGSAHLYDACPNGRRSRCVPPGGPASTHVVLLPLQVVTFPFWLADPSLQAMMEPVLLHMAARSLEACLVLFAASDFWGVCMGSVGAGVGV
eukprot:1159795-Pelagomonas_calceolata.AAC.4